jgi:hypothetical protein
MEINPTNKTYQSLVDLFINGDRRSGAYNKFIALHTKKDEVLVCRFGYPGGNANWYCGVVRLSLQPNNITVAAVPQGSSGTEGDMLVAENVLAYSEGNQTYQIIGATLISEQSEVIRLCKKLNPALFEEPTPTPPPEPCNCGGALGEGMHDED